MGDGELILNFEFLILDEGERREMGMLDVMSYVWILFS
jgi:hypothetical protein